MLEVTMLVALLLGGVWSLARHKATTSTPPASRLEDAFSRHLDREP